MNQLINSKSINQSIRLYLYSTFHNTAAQSASHDKSKGQGTHSWETHIHSHSNIRSLDFRTEETLSYTQLFAMRETPDKNKQNRQKEEKNTR